MAQRTACLVLEMHDVHAVSVEDLPARDELPATIVLTEMITNSPAAALVFPSGSPPHERVGDTTCRWGAAIDQ